MKTNFVFFVYFNVRFTQSLVYYYLDFMVFFQYQIILLSMTVQFSFKIHKLLFKKVTLIVPKRYEIVLLAGLAGVAIFSDYGS